ncbi:hypothetical protein GOBAR_AA28790 [Gossypium barbadense]|uniref:Uncharacterized protein n=1 Tax=Gossypium barbadense TaxID=3634 RepID=A0A2P5WLD8_GOSBA|nr:hypothetical protein GOBAR_AA28790 [Gossypium barbadense]
MQFSTIVREPEPIVMVNQCDCVKKNKELVEGEDETSSKANAPSEESSSDDVEKTNQMEGVDDIDKSAWATGIGMGNPVRGSCQGEDIGVGTVRSNQVD